MLATMGKTFGEKLVQAREAAGLSGYRLVQLSGIAQGNLQAIERGRRPPSDANLEALAEVAELGVTLEQLLTWRDLDRLGPEGLERIRKYAPEVLAQPPAPASFADAAADGETLPKRKPAPQIPGVTKGMPKAKPIPEADLYERIKNAEGATEEEIDLMREAAELGVDVGDVGSPDFLAQPVEDRRKTVIHYRGDVEAEKKKRARKGRAG